MPSIPATMTWEILRRGRWHLILATLGGLALPIVLLTALRRDGLSDMQDQALLNICVILMLNCMLLFGVGIFASRERISRFYAYPLRTSAIVAGRMLPAMVIVALQMSFGITVLNVLFNLNWPFWGPAMLAAVTMAAVDAAVWLTEKSLAWLFGCMTILGAGLGLWFRSRFGFIFCGPPHLWREVSVADALTMLTIGISAYWVAVIAVSRNRRGEPPISLGLADRLNRAFESMIPTSEPNVDSAFRAQCWMEWRRKGWVMPLCMTIAVCVGIILWLFISRRADDLLSGFYGGAVVLPMIAFAAGGVFGSADPNEAKYAIGHFLATRPLTDADLARAILKVAAQSVLLGWLIWALPFAIACGCVAANGQSDLVKLPSDARWWYFPATFIVPWIFASVMLSLGLLGRTKQVLQTLGCITGAIIVTALVSKAFLGSASKLFLEHSFVAALGAALLISAAILFNIARRRGLVETPIIWAAAAVWLAATLVFVFLRPVTAEPHLIGDALGAAVFALAIAPLAAAPLAVSLNRHR